MSWKILLTIWPDQGLFAGGKMELPAYPIPMAFKILLLHFGTRRSMEIFMLKLSLANSAQRLPEGASVRPVKSSRQPWRISEGSSFPLGQYSYGMKALDPIVSDG